MSISDAITSISTLVTIAAVVVGALLYIITKKPGKPGAKVLIITSAITIAIIVGIVGTVAFISASTTITINGQKNLTIPGFPAATETPTATPSPASTPIPITKNLDIPCIQCGLKIDIKLTTIVIDTTQQKSTWNFTLTNNDRPIDSLYFTTLVLEDNTGQKHQGGGLASTDRWNMSSGQSIQTYATFDVVHGTNYLLNIVADYGTYQTVTVTF